MEINIDSQVAMVLVGVGIGVPAICLVVAAVRLMLTGFTKKA